MTVAITVPMLPESVVDATVSVWYKKVGDAVALNEHVLDLETDKVVLEVTAPAAGVLTEITAMAGTVVQANAVLGMVAAGEQTAPQAVSASTTAAAAPVVAEAAMVLDDQDTPSSPAARRLAAEHGIDLAQVQGTGKGGRVTKDNVLASLPAEQNEQDDPISQELAAVSNSCAVTSRREVREPMSRLRAKVAERLLSVTQATAMLTTFNEINLQQVMELRQRHRDAFEKRHKVKLGFMSFFARAVVAALQRFPIVNASIDGSDIVYHHYYDLGVAVSTERGLVVPVLRDVDQLSMAAIEQQISTYAVKARDGKLALADMQGGTFTITNGGVFGSLLSTPIINAPQAAILGMHKIQERPVVENGAIVIRPMMYVALSYDHRLIDGKDSVSFLVAIKELLEDPSRLLLEI